MKVNEIPHGIKPLIPLRYDLLIQGWWDILGKLTISTIVVGGFAKPRSLEH